MCKVQILTPFTTFEGTNLTGEPLTKYYGDRLRTAYYQDTQPIYFVGYKWTM